MKPEKVKLIVGMIISEGLSVNEIENILKNKFSQIDFNSEEMVFTHTDYYYKEMGKPLRRKFISFKKLIEPGRLHLIKKITSKIEDRFSENGRRKINLDPGYIEPAKLILASTKNFYHRIYIGGSIYAEVTLCWQKGEFKPFEWTFPDYRTTSYRNIFKKIRKIYMKQKAENSEKWKV